MGKKDCRKIKVYYLKKDLDPGSSFLVFPNGSKIVNRELPLYGATPDSLYVALTTEKILHNLLVTNSTLDIRDVGCINYILELHYQENANGDPIATTGQTFVSEIISCSGKFLGKKGTVTTYYGPEKREITVRFKK